MTNSRYNTFAAYNQWANERIYNCAEKLTEAEFRADRGVFFKSMQGTLNHILVGDQLWMARFLGEGPIPKSLDEILFKTLPELRAARANEDKRIIDWVATLDDKKLAGVFVYTPITIPRRTEQVLAPALDHFFNHQTHHRGQAHSIFTGFGMEVPSLDLVAFRIENKMPGIRFLD